MCLRDRQANTVISTELPEMLKSVRGRECFSGDDNSTSGYNKCFLSLEPDGKEQTDIGQEFGYCP